LLEYFDFFDDFFIYFPEYKFGLFFEGL